MKWLLAIGGLLSFIVACICLIVWGYQFDKGCGDYLKLAGDAPTVERTDEFLGKALSYMEEHGLTQGNSAIIFKKPTSDVGIWYNQAKNAKILLENLLKKDSSAVTDLERSNALMKVREVVLDQGEKGTKVTHPPHISYFPHQVGVTLWWILGLAVTAIGAVAIFFGDDY